KFPPIGSDGIALETKAAGQKCKCYFEGFDIVTVLCREQIREKSHVLIIDGQRGAREGSPEEIKFYIVTTDTFLNVSTQNPLPVTMGTKIVTWLPTVVVVAAGLTPLLAPTAANLRIRVHYIEVSNAGAVLADVGLVFGTDLANVTQQKALAANGGTVNANLTDCNLLGAPGEVLNAWALGAYAGGVYFTIAYTEER
ncbi:unnamed protein product, partial [marine sediment metagenome]